MLRSRKNLSVSTLSSLSCSSIHRFAIITESTNLKSVFGSCVHKLARCLTMRESNSAIINIVASRQLVDHVDIDPYIQNKFQTEKERMTLFLWMIYEREDTVIHEFLSTLINLPDLEKCSKNVRKILQRNNPTLITRTKSKNAAINKHSLSKTNIYTSSRNSLSHGSSLGSSSSIGSAPMKDHNNKTGAKPKRSPYSGFEKLKRSDQPNIKSAYNKKHHSSKENIIKAFKKRHGSHEQNINKPKQAQHITKYGYENTLQVCKRIAKPSRVKGCPLNNTLMLNVTQMDLDNYDVEHCDERMHVEYFDENQIHSEDGEVLSTTKLLENSITVEMVPNVESGTNDGVSESTINANRFKDPMSYKSNEVAFTVKLLVDPETKVDIVETWHNSSKDKGILSRAWDFITTTSKAAWGSKKVKMITLAVLVSGAVVVIVNVGMTHFMYRMDENSDPTDITEFARHTFSNGEASTMYPLISSVTGYHGNDEYPYLLTFKDGV